MGRDGDLSSGGVCLPSCVSVCVAKISRLISICIASSGFRKIGEKVWEMEEVKEFDFLMHFLNPLPKKWEFLLSFFSSCKL